MDYKNGGLVILTLTFDFKSCQFYVIALKLITIELQTNPFLLAFVCIYWVIVFNVNTQLQINVKLILRGNNLNWLN